MPLEKLTRKRIVEALNLLGELAEQENVTLKEDLMLEEPWFSPEFPQIRMRLLRDTPSAFKDKNLFIFESALQVA